MSERMNIIVVDYLPFIHGRHNLTEATGFRIIPEKKNNEILIAPTVLQVENEFGPDVYILRGVPPLEEKQPLKTYKNPSFVIDHDYDPEIIPSNPGKARDPGLITLKGQSFTCHHRHP
jgi:hypothetical protein